MYTVYGVGMALTLASLAAILVALTQDRFPWLAFAGLAVGNALLVAWSVADSRRPNPEQVLVPLPHAPGPVFAPDLIVAAPGTAHYALETFLWLVLATITFLFGGGFLYFAFFVDAGRSRDPLDNFLRGIIAFGPLIAGPFIAILGPRSSHRAAALYRQTESRELIIGSDGLHVSIGVLDDVTQSELVRSRQPYLVVPWEAILGVSVEPPRSFRDGIPRYKLQVRAKDRPVWIKRSPFEGRENEIVEAIRKHLPEPIVLHDELK